jgi:hypothetical protein
VAIVIILIILALIFGGIGLLVEGLLWLLIISLVLVVVGGLLGFRGRSKV